MFNGLALMGKTLKEHHSNIKFCQATSITDFKFECAKMFLRSLVYSAQISNENCNLFNSFMESNKNTPAL